MPPPVTVPEDTPAPNWEFPVDNELVVVRPDRPGLLLLNATARQLWEQPDDEAAVKVFVKNYGIPEAKARRDIAKTRRDWQRLLSVGQATPEAKQHGDLILANAGFRSGPVVKPVQSEVLPGASRVTLVCHLNHHPFQIQLEEGDLVEEIAPRLAALASPASEAQPALFVLSNAKDHVNIHLNGRLIASEANTAAARAILLQEMTRLCEPGRTIQAILHAGACGSPAGAVVLAGATGSGKSTLCAALMAEGLTCYGDDSACLDQGLEVAGMPFPVMLRQPSWPVLEGRLTLPAAHRRWGTEVAFLPSNLPAGTSPTAPVKALTFVEYRPEAAPTLEPLTAFEALLALQRSGFWVEHDQAVIARFLAWIARLPRYRLTYSSVDDAIGLVKGLI